MLATGLAQPDHQEPQRDTLISALAAGEPPGRVVAAARGLAYERKAEGLDAALPYLGTALFTPDPSLPPLSPG